MISPGLNMHAIVSGGCSGIGLSLVRHLLDKSDWKVIVADINPAGWEAVSPGLDPNRTLFVQTDVADWQSHAALFKKAYEWSGEQIDFYAANAGIGERDSLHVPWDLDSEPTKPSLACVEVCELANYYGVKLFTHYARKSQQRLGAGHKEAYKPKIVMTASCAALYPFPIAPQYSAAKHAVLGYTRSIGATLYASENIAVNCIMPALVDTNILPPGIRDRWPQGWITPLSTIMRAYDELIDGQGNVEADGRSDGKHGVVKTAQSVECALDRLYYREHVAPPDDSQRFVIEDSNKPDGIWATSVQKKFQR